MKYSFTLLGIVIMLLVGCSSQTPSDDISGNMTVGMVFDVGGRGDKSFNDAAYKGLEMSRDSLGVDIVYIEPSGEGADREAALRQLAADPAIEVIFGVGLLFSEDISTMAEEFPEKYFVCIDYQPKAGAMIPRNLSGIAFEDKRGSFLAGALAGLSTKSGTIGFIGGMESNIIKRFENGFSAGAKYVNPDVKVISGYIGMTGSAFANPAKGKELALGQYARGVDIIYQAAGLSGVGVVEAARETGNLVIGTDRDQGELAPGYVLTSITKAIDRTVFTTVEQVQSGTFQGGRMNVFGLDGRYTDYVYNTNNASLIGDDVHVRVEGIRQQIIDGELSAD
ncbi:MULTISPECIES: BMP family lipoprotein [Prosthecochloris]|uniref:BMP family ABC transporter substrate-binding protein n=1 Tax=Prosthecochloris marina TaxID=2017681 RepID=A0A317T8K9_9CHLB|nr:MULTISPECIES: BMP family ABC transporter substrate-binding protein [Prosthecochloris]PWW83024.1 BMP family ABC transporter substrate-binding protein [Prosthecochloris marina]UZJ38643.1 BMP family ABC transporter substrate-binding protein [Prosthecochloris sp. SCSIO W1103]